MTERYEHRRVFRETYGEGPWACHGCGEPVTKLFVHHKDENPSNNEPTNLVAMHRPCHQRLHQLGKTRSAEHRQKLIDVHIGSKHSDEACQKMRKARLGTHHSAESRAKMSESQKLRFAKQRNS